MEYPCFVSIMEGGNKRSPPKPNRDLWKKFIELYRAQPCLWDAKSNIYFNKERKQKSYEELVELLRNGVPEANVDYVKCKINCFRTNFRKELRKVNMSKSSGKGPDEVYVPNLWYYNLLLFLCDSGPVDKSESHVPVSENEERSLDEDSLRPGEDNIRLDGDSSVLEKLDEPSVSFPTPKKKPRKANNMEQELLHLAYKRLKTPETKYDQWAQIWANELKEMEPPQQLYAIKAINDIMFEGKSATLNRQSVVINGWGSSVSETHYSNPLSDASNNSSTSSFVNR